MPENPAFRATPTHAVGSEPAIPTIAVVATMLGNALEFYDFTSYAFFAVVIGHAFFPAQDPFISLLLSVKKTSEVYFLPAIGGGL